MSAQTSATRFFRRFASSQVTIPRSHGNVYELFIYTLVCQAVSRAGHRVSFHTTTPGQFRFRTSPGGVNNAWGYCSFRGVQGTYEVRNGVEVAGHSNMRHESDIAIFRVPANQSNTRGLQAELVLTIECKHYSSASGLKAEARKNLGMVQDWSQSHHPSRQGPRRQGCIHCGLHFQPLFVTNVSARVRPDIEGYLEAYDLGPHFGVIPQGPAEARFVADLSTIIQGLGL